jgi:preprotein translocase subunit YajC
MDTTGSAFTPLIFLFTFMILLYFMSVRPQQKRAKELQNMMNNLERVMKLLLQVGFLAKLKKLKVTMLL